MPRAVHDPTVADRRALRSVAVQFWMNGVVIASFIPRLPEIRDRLGIGVDQLGLLLTSGVVGGLAASALCGRAIDRFGTRGVMTAASAATIAVIPLLGLARTTLAFLAVLVALQFFDVLIDVPMNLQGAWLSARRETPVINRLHGMWSVGNVTGGVVAVLAASRISLELHLVLVSLGLLGALLYIVPGLPRVDDAATSTPADDGAGVAAPAPVLGRDRTRLLATFAVLGALAIVTEIGPADWAAIRLVDDVGLDPSTAAIGFVAFTVGMVIGRFGGDSVSARVGRLRMFRWAIVVSAVGLLIAGLASQSAVAITGFLIAGLGTAVIFPGLYDLAARAPGRPGDVLGAMTAGIRVGVLVVPVTVGRLASGPLGVGQAMLIVGLPAAAGLWALSWIGERP